MHLKEIEQIYNFMPQYVDEKNIHPTLMIVICIKNLFNWDFAYMIDIKSLLCKNLQSLYSHKNFEDYSIRQHVQNFLLNGHVRYGDICPSHPDFFLNHPFQAFLFLKTKIYM